MALIFAAGKMKDLRKGHEHLPVQVEKVGVRGKFRGLTDKALGSLVVALRCEKFPLHRARPGLQG
jgi:hypothetical protein